MRSLLAASAALFAFACTTPEPAPQKATSSQPATASASQSALAASATAPDAPTDAPPPDPKPVLDALRAGLEKVRATKGKESFELKEIPPVDALVGQSRDAIETALGKPSPCEANGKPAPCQSKDDVFYSLYKLADGMRGGGPELLLTYDEDAFCTRAERTHTR